jgi:hypothetical protein
MTKIAIIVGGVVLMAGVALAGTLTSLGSSSTPAGQTISPPAAATTTTGTVDDRGQENELRGRANEAGEDQRGRENEAGEDLRGPCDEAEHANDARCTGAAATAPRGDDNAEDVGDDHGGGDHSNRGSGGGDDSSGHGGHGGDDD